MYDYTHATAKTPAQRRDAILIADCARGARQALRYRTAAMDGTPLCAALRTSELCGSIRTALEVARVRYARVTYVPHVSGYGDAALWIAPANPDQYDKVRLVMAALGFVTDNAHHYRLTEAMRAEGFSL
jgi:hypothetical protein